MVEISVLLCVCDDIRIKDCLDSVDLNCEVIVVANQPSNQVRDLLRNYSSKGRFEYKLIEIEERGISLARDIGAEAASYEKLLFMDSDCVFIPEGLKETAQLLDEYALVDARVDYKFVDFQSSIVSQCRKKSVPNRVFCPGLALHKSLKSSIGGYFFDKNINWLEDSEINIRFRKAKITASATENYIALHDSLTFRQDLKSVYRYGRGKKLGIRRGVFEKELDAIFHLIPSYFKESFALGVYLIAWNLVYTWGFVVETIVGRE